MAADMHVADLKVQSDLLDPSFDGYKLSLEPLPTYKSDLVNDLDIASLTDKQYSYQHIKAFGCHNHLLIDQWAVQTGCYVIYFIDKDWNVRCVELTMQDGIQPRLVNVHSPFQVLNPSNLRLVPGRHNVSMSFPAPDWAVIADGAGTLHLVETGPRFGARAGHSNWQVRFSKSDVLGENRGSFVLCDAVMHSDNEGHHTECLLLHVDEADEEMKDKSSATFMTVLEWLSLTSQDKKIWSVSRTRRLRSSRSADCCSFERNGEALYVAGERAFNLIYDSACPVADSENHDQPSDGQDSSVLPEYTWLQTTDSVSVNFTLPEGTAKEDIYMTLHQHYMDVGIKNGQVLLSGDLHAGVEVESSTWTIETNKLKVHLHKKEPNMWPLVIIGNTKGEMVMSEEQVAEIHQRLEHLTAEQWNANPEVNKEKPYNAQELEDCDAYPDMQSMLVRIEGDTHNITHQAYLGSHQWLFNTFTDVEKSLAICLRHDVDGLIWQLGAGDSSEAATAPWRHIATFNAFGYVQASKQQKKYSACPPDFSYAAVCDCTRHTYIYRQPAAINTPLRNRKTGRQVMAIAKQQVLSLEGAEEILGVQATNKFLFILTPRRLHAVNMERAGP